MKKVYDRYTSFEMNNDKGNMYDSGKDFVENFLCQNPVMTGVRWLNFLIMEILVEFDKDSKLKPK